MDVFSMFLGIVLVVFGILQIILFFKIWGMTNDVREIKEKYLSSNSTISQNNQSDIVYDGNIPDDNSKFKENDLVVLISTGKQMRVKRITEDGKYSCYINGGTIHQGNYNEDEIRLFKL